MKKVVVLLTVCLFFSFSITAISENTGEYFFKNNISGDARLTDMYMLGAHDAFTASHSSSSPADAAAVKAGDSGAQFASNDIIWSLIGMNSSKAQSADVNTMLNAGVRYFDVRLSKYLSGGEFYTTHGRISDQFTGQGGVAGKIAAWAAKHPGEVIILDFQSLFDIDTSDGKATQDSWKNLAYKLEKDGVMKYVYTRNGSLSNITYNSLTNGGTRCAIVVFGQVTGSWADDRFINRRDSDGYVRSYWTDTSSFEDLYNALESEGNNLKENSDSYHYKLRIMQAQTTAGDLINDANDSNIKVLTGEKFDKLIELMPVFMVDNATTESGNFNSLAVDKLARKNREYVSGVYRESVGLYTLTGNNENVPLNTKFEAVKTGETLKLSLTGNADITGEMTLIIKSDGKRQKLYRQDLLLGETGDNGILKATIDSLGEYKLIDGENIEFSATTPLLWYNFTDENALHDITGNGLDAQAVGNPEIGKGKAVLSDGNVIKLPSGITKGLKGYTVSAWVNMTKATAGSRLFDIGRSARSSMFAHAGSDKTSAGYKLNGGTTVTANGGGLKIGEWTHVAASYNKGTITVYVNGKAASTAKVSDGGPENIGDIFNPNGNFIGRTQWYFDEGQRGINPDINAEVADFRIYGEALSDAEIARLARVPEVKMVDSLTGKIIKSYETTIPLAYNGFKADEKLEGGYALEGAEWVSDMAGNSNVVLKYKRISEIKTDVKDGAVTARVVFGEEMNGVRLYLAIYDKDMLAAVQSTVVNGLEGEICAEIEEGERYEVYLWDESMQPMN